MAERYGVWRLRRNRTWRLLHTFKDREKARRKAEDLRRQIMTVRWGKMR
jgi:hypothetical protein